MLSDTYNDNLSLSVVKTLLVDVHWQYTIAQKDYTSQPISQLLAAALLFNTWPISKTVVPISHLDNTWKQSGNYYFNAWVAE